MLGLDERQETNFASTATTIFNGITLSGITMVASFFYDEYLFGFPCFRT